jgi:hypothetical protein
MAKKIQILFFQAQQKNLAEISRLFHLFFIISKFEFLAQQI